MDIERYIVIEHWIRTNLYSAQYPVELIPIMVKYGEESDDFLDLSDNTKVQKMLNKMGDNFCEAEKVILSRNIIKINKRGKEQQRILLFTDKALYNMKSKSLHKCYRRIDLHKIASITTSTTSDVFAVHIPEEYDYRYKIKDKQRVIHVLARLWAQMNSDKKQSQLPIKKTSEVIFPYTSPQLSNRIGKQRLQTREQRFQCHRERIGREPYLDETDNVEHANVTGQLLQSSDTVHPNDFEHLKVIGRGAMGKLVQVRKKDTGQVYAMKILKKKALIEKHQVEHCPPPDILKSMRLNQHPFMMALRWGFQTESKIYFVMEYYRGAELFFHLKKKRRFTEQQTKIITAEVALALGHIHDLDYIYRELKPKNVLMNRDGHICLMDTCLLDLEPSFPDYLAPEIIMNLGYGKAVDWWSFGILVYELTVGIPPFYSQNINEMYRKIQNAALLFPPNLSVSLKDLICKLLERNPKQRLGSNDNDVIDIKNHTFFGDINWDKLYNKEIQPLYKPRTHDDTSSFDTVFLNEKVVDGYCPSLNNANDGFDGFTYNNNPTETFDNTIGLSLGGAKDVNNFRECIGNNKMPSVDSITYNGLLNEYYFDTMTKKHIEENKMDIDQDSQLFYPTYCYAKTKKLSIDAVNDDNKNEYEYFMSVGLNSNIKQKDFKRKHLNLVLLLDKSGSMLSGFKDGYSKMNSAKDAALSLIQQLTSNDRLGIVLFDGIAHVLNELQLLNDINMDKLRNDINNISASNSTNFDGGYNMVIESFTKLFSDAEHDNMIYDNRVIILTDAQPNGRYNSSNLLKMVETAAENKSMRIYTTFIGIGLDFNSSLIQSISESRGCNYYSVKSKTEFEKQMNEEFDLMVTPLVFNVCLTMKCEGDSCEIERVFGSHKSVSDKIIENGEIVRIHSLFASNKSASKGDTKGGLQLIKLKMKHNHNENVNVELSVTFQDRNCKSYKNSQNITFKTPIKNTNDMIEEEEHNYFDNHGIRKAILLCKYVDLMKQWINSDHLNQFDGFTYNNNPTQTFDGFKYIPNHLNQLRVSHEFKTKFTHFLQYFKQEMLQCQDDTLNKEIDIINMLMQC